MKDNLLIILLIGFFAGLALASFYFGGLWFTLERLSRMKRPILWMLSSYVLRMAAAAVVFLLLALWCHWTALIGSVAGFIIVRMFFARHVGTSQSWQGRS